MQLGCKDTNGQFKFENLVVHKQDPSNTGTVNIAQYTTTRSKFYTSEKKKPLKEMAKQQDTEEKQDTPWFFNRQEEVNSFKKATIDGFWLIKDPDDMGYISNENDKENKIRESRTIIKLKVTDNLQPEPTPSDPKSHSFKQNDILKLLGIIFLCLAMVLRLYNKMSGKKGDKRKE